MDEKEVSYKRKLEDLKKYHILYQTPTEASGSNAAAQKEGPPIDVIPDPSSDVTSETENLVPESWKILLQTFPEIPLQNIFEHLKLKDLTNVQYVCSHWHTVAQNQNLWRNKTYRIRDSQEEFEKNKWQLVNAPMLQNFVVPAPGFSCSPRRGYEERGYGNYEILETLLRHQKHLCMFEVYSIQQPLIHKVITKFPQVEDISIGIFINEAVSILDELKSCSNLKHLKCQISGDRTFVTDITMSLQITELLGNFFTSLKSLNLSSFQKFLSSENIKYILERKLNQLESLELNYCKDEDDEIISFVLQRSNPKLHLNIEKELNLRILRPFQSLSLYVSRPKTGHLLQNMLQDRICLLNVEKLCVSEWFYKDEGFPCQRLKDVFPNIKSFTFDCAYHGKLDGLACLADFPYLKEICVSEATGCTPDVLLLISKCSTLKSLELNRLRLTSNSVSSLSHCSGLHHLIFKYCYLIDVQNVLLLLNSLHRLQTFSLFDCSLEVYMLNAASLAIIESECNILDITFSY